MRHISNFWDSLTFEISYPLKTRMKESKLLLFESNRLLKPHTYKTDALVHKPNNKTRNLKIMKFNSFREKHLTVEVNHQNILTGIVVSVWKVSLFSTVVLESLNFKVGLVLENTFLRTVVPNLFDTRD